MPATVFSPEQERLVLECRALIKSSVKRIMKDESWREDVAQCRHSHAERLHQVLTNIQDKYAEAFVRMCEMLQPKQTTAYPQFVGVTDELFRDGINWGRIATLLAFGAHLGMYFQDHGMPEMVPSVIGWLQRLAENDLLVWIQNQQGWEGFYQHFNGAPAAQNRTENSGEVRHTSWKALGLWAVAAGAFAYFTSK